MPSTISYHIPSLGHVSVPLWKESETVYKALSESRKKEISRIKDVPNLGIVSKAYEGARHSRWEYVVLTMYLIEACQIYDFFKVSSGFRLSNGSTVSSASELMKSWAMLLATGHLYWTFTTEKLLLDEIYAKKEAQEKLLHKIPNATVKSWAQEVINERNYYYFHYLISYYRIDLIVEEDSDKEMMYSLLNSLILDTENETLERSKKIFKRIKRIAFLHLDGEYSPTLDNLKLSRVLRDKEALEKLLYSDGEENDELSSFEANLIENVYLGKKTLLVASNYERAVLESIQSSLSNNNITSALQDLAYPRIYRKVMNHSIGCRLNLAPKNPITIRKEDRIYNSYIQKQLLIRWASRHNVFLSLSYNVIKHRGLLIYQIHYPTGDITAQAACISYSLKTLNQIIDGIFRRFKNILGRNGERFLVDNTMNNPNHHLLIIDALNLIFQNEITWVWSDTKMGFKAAWLLNRRKDIVSLVQNKVNESKISEPDKFEIDATISASKGLKGHTVMNLCNIVGYKDKTHLLELDGVVLSRDSLKNELVITLVEAKRMKKRAASSAVSALEKKLKYLNTSNAVNYTMIRSKKDGKGAYAWCHVRLSYSKLQSANI